MTAQANKPQAYLVGGGIASMAAATFLIRDAGFDGSDIHILEESTGVGGALDGSGDRMRGYVTRGGRMLEEEAYVCLWNLLESIPTLTDPSISVRDEITQFNDQWRTEAKARLIGRDQTILDAADLGFDTRDRLELTALLAMPERLLGARRIDEFFSPHFFDTNFWAMWRTTFAFQNWHSAIELKRYFLRFIQEFPRIHTLAGVRRTRLNQYDSLVRPIQSWLAERGVVVELDTLVLDADFAHDGTGRRIERLHVERAGTPGTVELSPDDLAIMTIGSMTSDATYGTDDLAPELVRGKRDGAWILWENIAAKEADLGRPRTFNGDIDEAKWESFTLTMSDPLLLHRIEEFSGSLPGTGALMTFKDSRWLLSIVVPHQPHFDAQPVDEYTLWGYGLFLDTPGDFVDTTMSQASGQEILTELIGHLGFEDTLDVFRKSTTVIPVMMPYITSQFAVRALGDRPPVVPKGSTNFALLGQYVEIPEDVVFTVEFSVRGAMHAVYELCGIDKPIPDIYHGLSNPKVAFDALRTALG